MTLRPRSSLCCYRFAGGSLCKAAKLHAVHLGQWAGPEPNHDFQGEERPAKAPPTWDEWADTAVVKRLREVVSKPAPNVAGCDCDRDEEDVEEIRVCGMHTERYRRLSRPSLVLMLIDLEAVNHLVIDLAWPGVKPRQES